MPTLLTAQDWIHLQEIFGAAVEMPHGARESFLDEACNDDPVLRMRVESLLHSVEEEDWLGEKVVRAAGKTLESSLPAIGCLLGSYEITAILGRGGMGVVYRAIRADDEYNKEVAIKVAAYGLLTPELRRRFLRERQILANLDHPNIARLLDGGTTDAGMPFVVMEFVAGKPIDDYCTDASLNRRARIKLMIEVARAVDYAHRHLVVHRDLKPDNILVTQSGEPKLLDFGIAKALGPEAAGVDGAQTVDAARLMTPDYASPEQVRGQAITTATDVYQLGVLLYLLLVGRLPFQTPTASMGEMERMICDTPPPQPNVDLDLDRVVLQALEKDPSRRYSSAEALAEDLDRYLGGFPVRARSNSFAYRTRKFISRHKFAVAAASLFVILVLAVSVGIALLARRLDRERNQAEVQLHRSERVSRLLEDVFGGADPNIAQGKNPTARELLDRGTDEVGRTLDKEPEVQASLYSTLGHIYDNLGVIDRAESLMQRSLAIRRKQFGENSIETAKGLNDEAELLHDQGENARAEAMEREALRLRESLIGKSSPETAETLNLLGMSVVDRGSSAEGETLFRRAIAIWEQVPVPIYPERLMPLNNLSRELMRNGDYASAETTAREMLSLARSNLGEDAPDTAQALKMLGSVLQSSGKHDEAERVLREALAVEHKTLDPANMSIGLTELYLGQELQDQGKFKEAEQLESDAIQIESAALGPESPTVAAFEYVLALLYKEERKMAKAEPLLRNAMAIQMKQEGAEGPGVCSARDALAETLVARGKLADARTLLDFAMEAAKKSDGGKGLDTAEAASVLGKWLVANHELPEAEVVYRQVLAIDRAKLPNGHPSIAEALEALGGLMVRDGRKRQAEPLLTEAVGIRMKTSPPGSPRLRASQDLLAQARRPSG